MTGDICLTPGCGQVVTSTHPRMWTLCVACALAPGQEHARKERERVAHLPTVGRRVRPQSMLLAEPLRAERVERGETPEARVTRESLAALRSERLLLEHGECGLGIWLLRNNQGIASLPGRGKLTYGLGKGTSDFVGGLCPSGVFAALEMKAPGEKPTKEQTAFLERVRARGGWAEWSDSAERTVAVVRAALVWASGRGRA